MTGRRLAATGLAAALAIAPGRAASSSERIAFVVTTIDGTSAGGVLARAVVDGPAGTDFDVHLRSERFRMTARFLTDLVATDTIRMRSRLDVRRHYGTSERGLPLYEEDRQHSELELGFDDALVLLPFGGDPDDTLRIEIVPRPSELSPRLADGSRRPLEIDLVLPAPGAARGEIAYDSGVAGEALANLETLLALRFDRRHGDYLRYQTAKEGVARYVEYRLVEEAASSDYRGTPETMALTGAYGYDELWRRDYGRSQLYQLKHAGRVSRSRLEFYSLGLGLALTLDRVAPDWQRAYFDDDVWLDTLLTAAVATAEDCAAR